MDSLAFKLLLNKLYRLLSIRARSEKEIRDYFKIRNKKLKIKNKPAIADEVINELITHLKQKDLINDLEFTKAWVESRSRKKGLRVIKQELFQKGIDREIIEIVISRQSSDIREEEVAKKLLEKKIKVWKNLSNLEFKKKAYEFLMRKGFEYEIVKDIIENMRKKM